MASALTIDTSSAPLADWFFIAGKLPYALVVHKLRTLVGVDSEQLKWGDEEDPSKRGSSIPQAQSIIEEDHHGEAGEVASPSTPTAPRHAKRNSGNRLSRLSNDARLSIQSVSLGSEKKGTDSNRSSATIKAVQISGTGGLNDVDFEKALRKFASERESFLSDLTLSAGAVIPPKPRPRPKTQKIVSDENNALKPSIGSVRRRISFRDMTSLKKQPSVMRRGMYPRMHTYASMCRSIQGVQGNGNCAVGANRFYSIYTNF